MLHIGGCRYHCLLSVSPVDCLTPWQEGVVPWAFGKLLLVKGSFLWVQLLWGWKSVSAMQEVLSVQDVPHLTILSLAAGSSLMCSDTGKL